MATLHLHAKTDKQLDFPQANVSDPSIGASITMEKVEEIVTKAIAEIPTAPIPAIPEIPDHSAKLAEFEKQLSDVCDFANKAVPMLCSTMDTYNERLTSLQKKHDAQVDLTEKVASDAAIHVQDTMNEHEAGIDTLSDKIDDGLDQLDSHQDQIDQLTAQLKTHRIACYVALGAALIGVIIKCVIL